MFYLIFDHYPLSSVPGAPPQEVHGHAVDSRTLEIKWLPPPSETHNGVLTHFKVNYTKVEDAADESDEEESEKVVHQEVVGAEARSVTLKNLEEWTVYEIQVLASTKIGDGPSSDPVKLRTDEAGTFCLFVCRSVPPSARLCLSVGADLLLSATVSFVSGPDLCS